MPWSMSHASPSKRSHDHLPTDRSALVSLLTRLQRVKVLRLAHLDGDRLIIQWTPAGLKYAIRFKRALDTLNTHALPHELEWLHWLVTQHQLAVNTRQSKLGRKAVIPR